MHKITKGPRTGSGSYHLVQFSDEHGMELSVGMAFKEGSQWTTTFDRSARFPTLTAAVEAANEEQA